MQYKLSYNALGYCDYIGQLSLAIPLRVGKMSAGDGYDHCWGRNGKFCVTDHDCWHIDLVD